MKKFLSANEAVAHAAAQAGCVVASAYPGTPSTEILENIAKFKDTVKCEWAVNEKVAMETAIGALRFRQNGSAHCTSAASGESSTSPRRTEKRRSYSVPSDAVRSATIRQSCPRPRHPSCCTTATASR